MLASTVLTMCDRWHKTPDEILAMDVTAIRMIRIAELGGHFESKKAGP